MLKRLVVFVEEPSAEAALNELLPRILGNIDFDIRPFQSKTDLLTSLPSRLAGYSSWLPDQWAILVLVDRDDDNCQSLKRTLENIAQNAGLITKTTAQDPCQFQVLNRIIVEELEAWFFGDWPAVKAAYPRVPDTIPQKASYRDPDAISGGTWEAIERILKKAGYFSNGLRKIEFARNVARNMAPERNTSRSFIQLSTGLQERINCACSREGD